MQEADRDFAREELLNQMMEARTLPQIEAAKQALRCWLEQYPEEPGMADGFEMLSHREDWAKIQSTPIMERREAVPV